MTPGIVGIQVGRSLFLPVFVPFHLILGPCCRPTNLPLQKPNPFARFLLADPPGVLPRLSLSICAFLLGFLPSAVL